MHSAKHLAFCAIVSAAVAVPCAARPFGMVFDHASAPWNAMKDRELRAAAFPQPICIIEKRYLFLVEADGVLLVCKM